MTITNGYATLAELKAYADINSTDGADDAVLEDMIEAASRLIDNQVKRTFYARTETRYFDVPVAQADEAILYLDDDLLTVTTLTNGSSGALTATDYRTLPVNGTPKWGVQLKGGLSWESATDGDPVGSISIVGTWGWSSTAPDDIKQACLMIANSYRQKRSGQGVEGNARVTSAGVVIQAGDIPKDAARILLNYRRVWMVI